MPVPLDRHKAEAMCMFLHFLDNNRGQWKTPAEWRDPVRALMGKKKFKRSSYSEKTGRTTAKSMEYSEWRDYVYKTLMTHRKNPTDNMKHLFDKGSDVFKGSYLEKIGYPQYLASADQQSAATSNQPTAMTAATAASSSEQHQHLAEESGIAGGEETQDVPTVEDSSSEIVVAVGRDSGAQKPSSTSTNPNPDGQLAMRNEPAPRKTKQPASSKEATSADEMQAAHEKVLQPMPDTAGLRANMSSSKSLQRMRTIETKHQAASTSGLANPRHLGLTQFLDQDVIKYFEEFSTLVDSLAANALELHGLESQTLAVLVLQPSKELECLYLSLFGKDWRRNTTILIQSGRLRAYQLLAGLIHVAIHEWVTNKPLPWKHPREILQEMQSQHLWYWCNQFLAEDDSISMEHILWTACRRRIVCDEAFQNEVMVPLASELATKFWQLVAPQMAALGLGTTSQAVAKGSIDEQIAALQEHFYKALRLKGQMEVTPEDFTVQWMASGTELDLDTMDPGWQAVGRYDVSYCTSPLVIRLDVDGNAVKVVKRAKVFLQPAGESGRHWTQH